MTPDCGTPTMPRGQQTKGEARQVVLGIVTEERGVSRFLGVCISFFLVVGCSWLYFRRFVSASLFMWALAGCLLLVPLVYVMLGEYWMRFCSWLVERPKSKFWKRFIVLQVLLTVASFAASFVSELQDLRSDIGSLLTSAGCLFVLCLVSFGTHSVGIHALNLSDYRFYQPFEGGALYVALQAASWILFSVSFLMLALRSICSLGCVLGKCGVCLVDIAARFSTRESSELAMVPATSTAMLAEVLMIVSLLVYRSNRPTSGPGDHPKRSDGSARVDGEWRGWQGAVIMAFVFCCFKPEIVLWSIMYLSLSVGLPTRWVATAWAVGGSLYASTYGGDPSRTGSRSWPAFQRVAKRIFDRVFVPYFSLSIVRDSPKPLDPAQKYIFGYHPHAIIPIACQWTCLTSKWEAKFPGIRPATLVSSIVHMAPIMRDVTQWNGGFEVSREGFREALAAVGSVMLVPGGQEEMIGSRSDSTEVPINTRHRGFVRLALQTGASLVPVYSFGETQTFDNVRAPVSWQRWCMKKLRANLICYPYGTLPMLPRPQRITLVVGTPIEVPRVEQPTESQIAYFHALYFEELRSIFQKHKDAAGRAKDTLKFNFPVVQTGKFKPPRASSDAKQAAAAPASPQSPKVHKSKRGNVIELLLITLLVSLIFISAVLVKALLAPPAALALPL